ncbi:MAG: glycosyl hydrolase [Acidimicrobiales bacterium]
MRAPKALLLSGSLGLGHEMLVRSCRSVLEADGWAVRSVDCMSLLGRRFGHAGQRIFDRMIRAAPGLYDGLHFAHLRTGSSLARAMDASACARLVPALGELLDADPPDLVLSVFATGASAAARCRRDRPGLKTVVLCSDVTLHRLWVADGTDLFLATSPAAAASVLRYLPRARVAVIPPPVRSSFFDAPDRDKARAELGLARDARCVLVIDSGWGFGIVEESVRTMAAAGIDVLAVAGRRTSVERRFRTLASHEPHVRPFGFVDDVPLLMAAADAVMTLPGATTCSEARVVGRPLLLLDLMPGHGRENLLHELVLGDARACGASPEDVADAALALLEQPRLGARRAAVPWEGEFRSALRGIDIGLDIGASAGAAMASGGGTELDHAAGARARAPQMAGAPRP